MITVVTLRSAIITDNHESDKCSISCMCHARLDDMANAVNIVKYTGSKKKTLSYILTLRYPY